MNKAFRAGIVLLLPALLLPAGCGKTESPAKPGDRSGETKAAESKPAPAPTAAGPIAIEPAASVDAKALKPGLKLTAFPNNRFSGPGETDSIAPGLGFDCDKNSYAGKEASLRYAGWLKVDKDGTYCLQIVADDQITFSLNGKAVFADFTGIKEQKVILKAGYYPLRLDYQNNVGAACLSVKWAPGECVGVAPIEAARFFH
jgi:hypothetical protein